MQTALAIAGAYLLGSISFAIVVSRLFALPDPRTFGSKNPGATNVLRTGKKTAAALTLLGDGGKGWLAVFVASITAPGAVALAALAVFLGHLFPVFHRFRGGKGVATAAGVLLGLDWRIGLGTIASWVKAEPELSARAAEILRQFPFATVDVRALHAEGARLRVT